MIRSATIITALLPSLALAQPLPQPKPIGPGGSCPHGYTSSGSFCVPRAGVQDAIPLPLLLTQANGKPWGENPNAAYQRDVIEVVKSIGLDPDKVTLYALRHSSITHALVRKVPIRVVAAAHDASVQQIERTYSKKITEHLDAETRKALLLHPEPPTDDNVVAMPERRPS